MSAVHNHSHSHQTSVAQLPPRPTMPAAPPSNADAATLARYDREMLQYKENMAKYNTRLQVLQDAQTEQQAKLTNMHKARHEVMMMIISNMK